MTENPFRKLPAINSILDSSTIQALLPEHGSEFVTRAIREELETLRQQLKDGVSFNASMNVDAIALRVQSRLDGEGKIHLRTVINATGIVLHTNLGRSPLSERAAMAAYEAGRGYLNLELELESGQRSSRQNPIREAICSLLGAESATVVNNCAAATVITLRTLAQGREVIVSRGQLIEIGGSFRIPEIMSVSGAILKEVGTTNITRIEDYEKAITPNTALLMRIHPSNYRVRGFTEEVSLLELVALGKKYHLPVVDDVGSGCLIDLSPSGLTGEPLVRESVAIGADVVLFSGDKLLGGPQAGFIVGKKVFVQAIERDPLMRAFRLDKMTLAALEVTLKSYRNPRTAAEEIPTLRMMTLTPEQLRPRCERVAQQLRNLPELDLIELRDEVTYIGGGSLPDQSVPTVVIALTAKAISETEFARRLRVGIPAVMARIQEGKIYLDLRTVFERQESQLVDCVRTCLLLS